MPRTATSSGALTNEQRAEIIETLQEACKTAGMKSRLADRAAISGSTASEVIGRPEEYAKKGDLDTMLRRLETALITWNAIQAAPKRKEFCWCQVAMDIWTIIKTTIDLGGIGVIHGPSGIGKSLALRAICGEKTECQNAVRLEINDESVTPLRFYHALIRAAGKHITNDRSRGWAFKKIRLEFSQKDGSQGNPILIDEADQLSNDTLNAVRQIHDATLCPIILVGRSPIMDKISKSRRDSRIGGSVAGRISIVHDLLDRVIGGGGGGNELLWSVDEIAAMLRQREIRLARAAARWLAVLAHLSALGDDREGVGLRFAIKVARLAAIADPGTELTIAMLHAANQQLRGRIAAAEMAAMIQTMAGQKAAATA